MILIIGNSEFTQVGSVYDALRNAGVDCEMFDNRWFPESVKIAYAAPKNDGWIRFPYRDAIHFKDIEAVYLHTYHGPVDTGVQEAEARQVAFADIKGMFDSLCGGLVHARWVNNWYAGAFHETKPCQLALVAQHGYRIPDSMIGNDPDAVLEFVKKHAKCIIKPVQSGAKTRPLTPAHLTNDNLAALKQSPVTIQEYIDGVDVRVFVIGDEVIACAMNANTFDYREDSYLEMRQIEVDQELADMALRIARILGLTFTGMDFRRTNDGEWCFFEANPSPHFEYYETRCGAPILDALIRVLRFGYPSENLQVNHNVKYGPLALSSMAYNQRIDAHV